MNRTEYVSELGRCLSKLSSADARKYIDFCNEIIDDRIEEGLTEEEALSALGTPKEFAEQILSEYGVETKKKKNEDRRKLKSWEIILLSVGSPIWVSLGLALLAVILSLYIVLWCVDICLWAADLCFAACGFAGIAGGIALISTGHFPQGLFLVGCGFICVGLGIFWFFLCHMATKYSAKLTAYFPKILFKGKEIKE